MQYDSKDRLRYIPIYPGVRYPLVTASVCRKLYAAVMYTRYHVFLGYGFDHAHIGLLGTRAILQLYLRV